MTAVESSVSSLDLMFGCRLRLQQSPQSLGRPADGQQLT